MCKTLFFFHPLPAFKKNGLRDQVAAVVEYQSTETPLAWVDLPALREVNKWRRGDAFTGAFTAAALLFAASAGHGGAGREDLKWFVKCTWHFRRLRRDLLFKSCRPWRCRAPPGSASGAAAARSFLASLTSETRLTHSV